MAQTAEIETQETSVDVERYLLIVEELEKRVAELEAELEWDSLSVQEKIRQLAANNNVDTSLALNIACAESMFHPKAQNPTSSAGGVFQWLDSSWALYSKKYYGYVEEKMNPDRNIELSIWVLRDSGSRDWNASKHEGVGGGWINKPYERGLCPIA